MRIGVISTVLLLGLTLACGGGGNTPISGSQVSGAYEFVVTSNVTGGITLVEANLTASGSQSSAKGPSQVQILTKENKIWYVNGICFGATPGQNSLAANLSGNNIGVTFNEGGNSFSGEGVLTGTTVTGNYSVSNSKCPDLINVVGFPAGFDSGGFIGNQVPALNGGFSGQLTLPSGTDNAALTLTEAKDKTLKVIAALNGPVDNGSYTFSGNAIGNVMFISGTVAGKALSLLGYYDLTGAYTGTAQSLMVFDYETLANVGLLLKQ